MWLKNMSSDQQHRGERVGETLLIRIDIMHGGIVCAILSKTICRKEMGKNPRGGKPE